MTKMSGIRIKILQPKKKSDRINTARSVIIQSREWVHVSLKEETEQVLS